MIIVRSNENGTFRTERTLYTHERLVPASLCLFVSFALLVHLLHLRTS